MTPKQFRSQRFKQIEKAANKFDVGFSFKKAQTGTYYITLNSEQGDVTIRVADHPDVYVSADFNCDPLEIDDIKKVKSWIKEQYNFRIEKEKNAVVEYDKVPLIESHYSERSFNYRVNKIVETLESWAPHAEVDINKVKSLMSK